MPERPQDLEAANIVRLQQMLAELIDQRRHTTDPAHATHLADAIADLRTLLARAKGRATFEAVTDRTR
jgi:hypothetical protein